MNSVVTAYEEDQCGITIMRRWVAILLFTETGIKPLADPCDLGLCNAFFQSGLGYHESSLFIINYNYRFHAIPCQHILYWKLVNNQHKPAFSWHPFRLLHPSPQQALLRPRAVGGLDHSDAPWKSSCWEGPGNGLRNELVSIGRYQLSRITLFLVLLTTRFACSGMGHNMMYGYGGFQKLGSPIAVCWYLIFSYSNWMIWDTGNQQAMDKFLGATGGPQGYHYDVPWRRGRLSRRPLVPVLGALDHDAGAAEGHPARGGDVAEGCRAGNWCEGLLGMSSRPIKTWEINR